MCLELSDFLEFLGGEYAVRKLLARSIILDRQSPLISTKLCWKGNIYTQKSAKKNGSFYKFFRKSQTSKIERNTG